MSFSNSPQTSLAENKNYSFTHRILKFKYKLVDEPTSLKRPIRPLLYFIIF